ncbi:MAG: transcription termination/antitermination protein NusA [Acholeplasma sp.]|nr:transcription termination/antitermination protein NusA [Acholeplasma sp.]CCY28711.1 transcription termination factor NusA [Acholeplasma sp. CAG:878]
MDIKEFKKALEVLNKEKGISEDYIYEALELALTSAYKKNYHSLSNVRVEINKEKGEIHVYSFKTVVLDKENESDHPIMIEVEDDENEGQTIEEEKPYIFDERIHITLEDARKIVPEIKLGETIEEEVTPRDFGRVAAATAKQVVIQKIREAERNMISEEFGDKQDEMVTGLVAMEDVRNYYIDLGKTQGILPKTEIIPGETIKMGSNIKVYITKVENNSKGPLILLSRSHYGFVKRLFELEIPEINEGIIFVYSVAREAGVRSKIAVYSENKNVDAIGACIGEKGTRIGNILKELGPEKIDIVLYVDDKAKFIENALAPAKNLHVIITDEAKNEALVVVDDDNLSLAIGRKGLNVKLASRLTKFKIDIKTTSEASKIGINFVD